MGHICDFLLSAEARRQPLVKCLTEQRLAESETARSAAERALKEAEARLLDEAATRSKWVSLFALDDTLASTLRQGSIRLVRTSWFLAASASADFQLPHRQALEMRPDSSEALLSPDEAVDLLRRGGRCIGSLTYGWCARGHPDVTGSYTAAMRRFLADERARHIEAFFWDFCSVYQWPRTEAQETIFRAALQVMADLYASVVGTTVIRHKTIPLAPPPTSFEGEFNSRPYDGRGWPRFESGVATEGMVRASFFPRLGALLSHLPPKLFDIDGEDIKETTTAGLQATFADSTGRSMGAGPRIRHVRRLLKEASFTGAGDHELTLRLFNQYVAKIGVEPPTSLLASLLLLTWAILLTVVGLTAISGTSPRSVRR